MSLDNYVVNVTVSLGGPVITRLGLGTPLIVAEIGGSSTVLTFGEDDDYTPTTSTDDLWGTNVADTLDDMFAQPFHVSQVKVGQVSDITSVSTGDLDAIREADADWYYLLMDRRTTSTVDAVAETVADWVEASPEPRLALIQSDEDTQAVFGSIGDAGHTRVAGIYEPDVADYVAEAWTSFAGSADPEVVATSWAHRTLSGITPNELSSTLLTTIRGVNANYYDTLAGVGDMMDGKLLNGRFIDEQIAADWLATRVGEDLRALLLEYGNRNSKIPYNDAGFAIVASEVWKRLNQGIRVGHFEEGSGFVSMPTIVEGETNTVSPVDKAARILRFSMGADLTGAIHRVIVTINLETE